jgi:arylsulfatase A-like enzyme
MTRSLSVALALLLCFGAFGHLNAEDRPNALFIAVDDLNDWVGCMNGHPQAETPNIDRLAARGVLFTNAHCASPACNPSRAAVFSGLMSDETSVWSNDSPKMTTACPDVLTLPAALARAGYQTLGTGKLQSGDAKKSGFTEFYSVEQRWSPFTKDAVQYTDDELPSKGTSNPRHVITDDEGRSFVIPLNGMPSDRRPETTDGESFDWGPINIPDAAMGDTQITDWAIERMQTDFDAPFFLGVGFYRPHIPLWAPKPYFNRFENMPGLLPPVKADDLDDLSEIARQWALEAVTAGSHATVVEYDQWEAAVEAYLACVTYVDGQVGRLLDALDDSEFVDNTTIVLWSDHGWHLGEKQHWGKWTGWERSTLVPLIIVPPQTLVDQFAAAGSRCDQPVSLIDIYPTLAELCDATPPENLDGESLVPLLRDPNLLTGRSIITTFDPGNSSLRTDRWRYIRYADGSEELYDHDVDPNEWDNLSGLAEHEELMQTFRQTIDSKIGE